MPTCIIIPNTPDAETMICMMNKNIAAYLQYTLIEQGFSQDFVKSLLEKLCEAATPTEHFKYRCNKEAKLIISENEHIAGRSHKCL
jgi:hypothetical protein